MKIGKRFNQLTKEQYFFYIDNRKKYTDFNTLGLYRSILENERFGLEDQLEVLAYANQFFSRFFEFLQVKDPYTYLKLTILGQDIDPRMEGKLWDDIRKNQQRILKKKRIRHRNFGTYSKHDCGHDHCNYNGMMARQGSWIAEGEMWFDSDHRSWMQGARSEERKSDRKHVHRLIADDIRYSEGGNDPEIWEPIPENRES